MIQPTMNVEGNKPEHALSGSSYRKGSGLARAKTPREEDVRFPCIQNNEPDFFQSMNAELSVNHVVVPSWRASLAML